MFGNPNTPRRLEVAQARRESAEKSARIDAAIAERIELRRSYAELVEALREVDRVNASR